MVPVRCVCGLETTRLHSNLRTHKSRSCGCTNRRSKPKPEVGDTLGEWTVLRYTAPYHVEARCSCGTVAERYIYSLGTDSQSCGCLMRDSTKPRAWHKLRRTWRLIHARCYDAEFPGYEDYGARGIDVAEDWHDYENFYGWAVANGWKQGVPQHVDRIDGEKGYGPDNCRIVSPTRNARNKRNTVFIEAWGEKKPLMDWIEDKRCLVSETLLRSRISNGWNPEDALTAPARSGKIRPSAE